MKDMKAKNFILCWAVLVLLPLLTVVFLVAWVDPFIHYHYPLTEKFFYRLNNERSQNYGIEDHFTYDAVITGSSMTENFRTTVMDDLFGTTSVKLPYRGAYYKEINESLKNAFAHQIKIRYVVRGLDMNYFFTTKDQAENALQDSPFYLTDNNPFTDVYYIFNRDVVFSRIYPMLKERRKEDFTPGITSFDEYAYWSDGYTYGVHTVCPEGIGFMEEVPETLHITEEEKETIITDIRENVVSIAADHPETVFYVYIPPYSAIWWKSQLDQGLFYRQLEAEKIIIEEILKQDNIRLYSFNTMTGITTDLNNYRDMWHHGEWINSLILLYMKEGTGLLTADNYEDYLEEERILYEEFDYESLNRQEDYEDDLYAYALLCENIHGIAPVSLLEEGPYMTGLQNAEIMADFYEEKPGLICTGALSRDPDGDTLISDYLYQTEYIGARFEIEDITPYRFLVYYGKKLRGEGEGGAFLYNENGVKEAYDMDSFEENGDEWQRHLIDVTDLSGKTTLILSGGNFSAEGDPLSSYAFGHVVLY